MANTVTINIKNCCCGGSGSGDGGSDGIYDYRGLNPDLEAVDPEVGPPEGYAEPLGTLSDRQCKVAVFLYMWAYWIADNLANTTVGNFLLNSIGTRVVQKVLGSLLGKFVASVLSSVLSALGTGPDPSDAVVGVLVWVLSGRIASLAANEPITIPLMQDAVSKLDAAQDKLICQLSRATDTGDALSKAERGLLEAEMSPTQVSLIKIFLPVHIIGLLWYTADWWPSFDDDYLASITTTCCGDYVDGDPVAQGSDQACSAATFIVDQLIQTFKNFADVGYSIWADFNPFNNQQEYYYDYLSENLVLPRKLTGVVNKTALMQQLAQHIYLNSGYFFQVMDNQTLWEYADPDLVEGGSFPIGNTDNLAYRLTQLRSDAICALFEAASADDAHVALDAIIDAEIDLIDTEVDIKPLMKSAVDALVSPSQSRLLELLFTQDSDLLGYPGDCGDCGQPGYILGYEFETDLEGWTIQPLGQEQCIDAGIAGTVNIEHTVIDGDGCLRMTATRSSGNRIVIVRSPDIDLPLQSDYVLNMRLHNLTSSLSFVVALIFSDDTCANVISQQFSTVDKTFSIPLSAHAGKNLKYIQCYGGQGGWTVDVNFKHVRIEDPTQQV